MTGSWICAVARDVTRLNSPGGGLRTLKGWTALTTWCKKPKQGPKKNISTPDLEREMPEDYRTRLIPFDVTMILENSFGYFETIQDDARVLKEVVRVLEPRGRLLADVTDAEYLRTHHQPRSWEWIDKKHFVCREPSLSLEGVWSKRAIER